MVYALLCAVMKDERPEYIQEWIDYHLAIGFDAILIYDNGSLPPISDCIPHYSAVNIIPVPCLKIQIPAYNHCLMNAKEYHWARWIGFLDADEFLVPMQKDDIRDVLEDYEAFGGLGVNWAVFGPNGHRKRPALPQLYAYTKRFDPQSEDVDVRRWCRHVKCIVNPRVVKAAMNAHYFEFGDEKFCVDEHFHPIYKPFREQITYDVLRVNHYWTRSLEDFSEKMMKTRADTGAVRDGSSIGMYERFMELCTVDDNKIIEMWDRVKQRLDMESI